MTEEKEFKVIISSKGHIKLNGDVIAVLGYWNRYKDLEDDIKNILSFSTKK